MIEQRVKKILAQVFALDENMIDDESSSDSIMRWDSLGHMNLIAALEEEFAIHFTDEQMIEMLNYRLIVLTLQDILSGKQVSCM